MCCLCWQSGSDFLLVQPVALLHRYMQANAASCCQLLNLAVACDVLSFHCSSEVTFKKHSIPSLCLSSPRLLSNGLEFGEWGDPR